MERVDLDAIEAQLAEFAGPIGSRGMDITRLLERDVPALVAELRELRKVMEDASYSVEQLQQQRNDWVSHANKYARQRDDAHEEIARLEAQLRDLTDQLATADQPPGVGS